ncbi:GntR family transcriptional regulator [Pseudoruegeria sp. SK021]|uniref:GntR family transcriptional regulator n=1 Tax=Pseudoruegeria sp. SK021 TaxID=1933035 RepID=UPI000A264ECA|nr:GntR family transcriptional regulator [Pseudoruegeria sp. SK021]OSP55633.1 GntR family transcriptional regulator [Pseudoruegeria sp. SK021]
MQQGSGTDRRTTVDEIFDHLFSEINALRLLPGDRISEAEVAAQFGVSRQPVRDAFTRLANLDLLLIRPQRATEVKNFSSREIEKSRFVRASVEAEVLRRAAHRIDAAGKDRIDACLQRQRAAIAKADYHAFGKLDYEFHQCLCDLAGVDFAFEVISAEKAKVDRLCMLGLAKEDRMPQLLEDHEAIAAAIIAGDGDGAVEVGMLHLSRLDATIEMIETTNARYFEP